MAGYFLKIDEMYAFVASDDEGEGIMGMRMPNGDWMPFVGADMQRVYSLYPVAEDISKVSGKPFKIIKFSNRTDITEQVKDECKRRQLQGL